MNSVEQKIEHTSYNYVLVDILVILADVLHKF